MSFPQRKISIVTGRRQGPALRLVTVTAWVLAGFGALASSRWFTALGVVAICLVVATPLLRVGWLLVRWSQERDWRFVWAGTALLAVVATGAVLAMVNS